MGNCSQGPAGPGLSEGRGAQLSTLLIPGLKVRLSEHGCARGQGLADLRAG